MTVGQSWLGVLELLARTDNPALPGLQAQQWALRLEWAVVLAWLGMVIFLWVGRRLADATRAQRTGRAAAVVVGMAALLLPGEWSPTYWLGLAFQWPSLLTLVLCAASLWRGWQRTPGTSHAPGDALPGVWLLMLAALGWLLLLDTFALLPVQLYAMGFSPMPLAVLVALALAPLLWSSPASPRAASAFSVCLLLALLVHVLTRLPTGNVWDAVIDPWLWVGVQLALLRRLWARRRR